MFKLLNNNLKWHIDTEKVVSLERQINRQYLRSPRKTTPTIQDDVDNSPGRLEGCKNANKAIVTSLPSR